MTEDKKDNVIPFKRKEVDTPYEVDEFMVEFCEPDLHIDLIVSDLDAIQDELEMLVEHLGEDMTLQQAASKMAKELELVINNYRIMEFGKD